MDWRTEDTSNAQCTHTRGVQAIPYTMTQFKCMNIWCKRVCYFIMLSAITIELNGHPMRPSNGYILSYPQHQMDKEYNTILIC